MRIKPYKLLDVFRGLAALWVVVDHACIPWLASDHLGYLRNPLYWISSHGRLGVTVFFLISGYCIVAAAWGALMSGKSVPLYCRDRVRRIYPPYLAALVLTAASMALIHFANSHHLIPAVHHLEPMDTSLRYWAGNLLLLQSELGVGLINMVFWSLCYEIFFYVVIGVYLAIAKLVLRSSDKARATLVYFTLIGVSAMVSLGYEVVTGQPLFPVDLWHQFALGGLLFCLLELTEKTLSGWSRAHRVAITLQTGVIAALMLALAMTRQIGYVGLGFPSTRVVTVVALLFAAVLVLLRRWDERLSSLPALRPLLWLGGFSYSLYLAHTIVLGYVDIIGRRLGLVENRYWLNYLLQVAVALVFGRIFFLLVEKRFISKRQVMRLKEEHVA